MPQNAVDRPVSFRFYFLNAITITSTLETISHVHAMADRDLDGPFKGCFSRLAAGVLS